MRICERSGATLDIVADVTVAFFAAIGILSVLWQIVDTVSKSKHRLSGTLIYIPAKDEVESDAALTISSAAEDVKFSGNLMVLCSDSPEKEALIETFSEGFERSYRYKAGIIKIGKHDGADDIRGDD